MRTFVRVVEAGNLSAAARALRLSLPAVSRQITALEADLGTALILRTTRKMSVTESGRLFYERALRILRDVEDAHEAVRAARGPHGKVTITVPVTWSLVYLRRLLQMPRARQSCVDLDLHLEDRIVDLIGDGVDLAVRAGVPPPDSANVLATVLQRFRRVPVASPAYLRRNGSPASPDGLSRMDALIQIPNASPLDEWRFEKDGIERVVTVRGKLRSNVPHALREAALAGAGVALLPDWLVEPDLAARRLRRLLPGWSTPELCIYVVQRSDLRGSARVRAAIDLLRACVAEPPEPHE